MKRIGNRKSEIGNRAAFTLIELLVVIAIMGVLAGLTLSILPGVKRRQAVNTAGAELEQIRTALENYKAKYGVYPPSNPAGALTNQLYYELSGVTSTVIDGTPSYQTLDSASSIATNVYKSTFNVGGAINCTQPGGDPESAKAGNFLPALKPNRIGIIGSFNVLITSVRGPDANYQPLGVSDVNPFRYAYPGTNNPGSYDLWVQLVINGQTNLVCNWSREVQINSPLP